MNGVRGPVDAEEVPAARFPQPDFLGVPLVGRGFINSFDTAVHVS
ncbi:MAG: hypothetical protein ABSH56_31785 [Bryobacteraceae bacterium]|jgi:hypothetical protein